MRILLVALLLCSHLGWAQQWEQAVHEPGNFKVSFPATFTFKEEEQATDAGKLPVVTLNCMAHAGDNNFQYTVVYTYFGNITDGKPFGPEDEKAYFESVRANYTQGQAKLLHEQTGQFHQFSTYSLHLQLNDGEFEVSIWNVLAGTRGYLLQVITPRAKAGNADIQKFFDSFELLSLPAGSSNY